MYGSSSFEITIIRTIEIVFVIKQETHDRTRLLQVKVYGWIEEG